MCGIIGIFNDSRAKEKAKIMLLAIKNRGTDGCNTIYSDNHALGHCLHSLVGFVSQPIKGNGWLSSNCEIYNWKELAKAHNLPSKNDSHLLIQLLEKNSLDKIKETVKELDGPFAFAYWLENRLWLARDLLGIKPVWYSWNSESFYFASEKKALEKIGCLDIQELNPRHILIYDASKKAVSFIEREFFRIDLNIKKKQSLPKIMQELAKLLEQSVSKRLPQKKVGILFSGGIDSSLIAFLAKKLGKNFTCYTSAVLDKKFSPPEDLAASEKAAQLLGIKIKIKRITLAQVEKYLKTVVP
ncbi:asparagine synthetase B, partial [Candidatus Woesearchaeota archaeon]|nr:asparagine synthetase B [Candidatus Woesearchaeota archaeon]